MSHDPLGDAHWELWQSDPGQWQSPEDIVGEGVSASAPGTSAGAIRAARGRDAALAIDHDSRDWWWRTTVTIPEAGVDAGVVADVGEGLASGRLLFEGVSTHWTAWWDGEECASGDSMFRPGLAEVAAGPGVHELVLVCRALAEASVPTRPRAPWRSLLIRDSRYRWHRTSGVGRIPWHGTAAAVGPWRPVRLLLGHAPGDTAADSATSTSVADWTDWTNWGVRTSLRADGDGEVRMWFTAPDSDNPSAPTALPDGVTLRLDDHDLVAMREGDTLLATVPRPELWWPHTHGHPVLHTLTVVHDEEVVGARRIGFRTIEADTSDDGFALRVNGTRLHARGVCWVPPDPMTLAAPPDVRRDALRSLVAAGANVVRVTGTMAWEDRAFYDDCAEFGLLVWQDCMLHTLAPPDDPAWLDDLASEVVFNVARAAESPALAVVSGGSETEQQPTMWGLSAQARAITALEQTIPSAVHLAAPGVVHVTSTPTGGTTGGALPTSVRTGIAHWFGVGAYGRPLDDARRAGVRFVAECLAFAHPPERPTVRRTFGSGGDFDLTRWQDAVVRDPGASWDFQDSLAHYARSLFGVDPVEDLTTDPDRALDVLRATGVHATESTLAEWRRPGSTCAGAIVLSGRDLAPGAGWGLTDDEGGWKAALHGATRAWRPVSVLISDEGLDGLDIHLFNDTHEPQRGRLEIVARRIEGTVLVTGSTEVALDARSATTLAADEVIGSFRDLNHAWAFGPPDIDTVTVTWEVPEAVRAVHLVEGPARAPADVGLRVEAQATGDGDVRLTIGADRTATFIAIEAEGWRASDNWLHLAGGDEVTVHLHPHSPASNDSERTVATGRADAPDGPGRADRFTVRALNGLHEVSCALGISAAV